MKGKNFDNPGGLVQVHDLPPLLFNPAPPLWSNCKVGPASSLAEGSMAKRKARD